MGPRETYGELQGVIGNYGSWRELWELWELRDIFGCMVCRGPMYASIFHATSTMFSRSNQCMYQFSNVL